MLLRKWLMLVQLAQRTGGFLAVLIALCVVIAVTAPHLDRDGPSQEANLVYLPKAEYLRPLSLGYNQVLADILWFRTISYFGQHFRGDRMYPWLAHMCDLVTDLDPRAEHVYRFGGMVLPWEAGQADAGIQLLEKGIEALPDSWLLHYWVGFNYYFFKNDLASAAEHMRRAAVLPGAHANAARFAAVLAAEHQGAETAIRFLTEMRQQVDSEEMREVVGEHISMARLAAHLQQLNQAVSSYRTRFGEVPQSTSQLVERGLLADVPRDPFGGVYVIDPESGTVSSSTGKEPSKLHRSKLYEKRLKGDLGRDFQD
jgi:hypothetical protein